MFNPKKILVLAPHTDDGELGCGGTMARYCAEGREVYYAAFSTCAQSLPDGLAKDTLAVECKKATAALGIPDSRVMLFDFRVREFPASRQQILDELRKLNATIRPDLVLLPSATDIHQDHETVHREGLRAFRDTNIAGYELPWNQQQFTCHLFVPLTPALVDKKISALKTYASQSHRSYMDPSFITALARVRGVQCGTPFAEAFEVYRMVATA